jgi:hypothetical protein
MWIKYEVDRYWPRRLLYIPDMTSYERVGDDEYNTTKCPPYSIISYTWGRWEVKGDERSPAIPIKGVTWPIPAIDETHFTAETFESVVRQMNRNGVEWAWLDVACIDQTPGSISKMDEIGHQAAIFQQASACYVWFSHLSFQELTHAISIIDASMLALSNNTSDVDLRSVNRVLSSLRQALHHIFNDPWFSSLWTLQELVLRPDAIVFTSTGQPVIRQTGHPFFMTGFINDCFNIYSLLDYFEDYFERTGDSGNLNDRILNHTTAIQDQIRRAGFQVSYTNNPNVPYAQAKYRQAQERNDRIYGIMQIYGLRVGETVRPNHKIHFEELLDELALAINNRSPILGQLYLHTTRPPAGKGWRIS